MKKLIVILSGAICATVLHAQTEKKVDFTKDIKPIFRETCIKCHGEEKQKGKLRLDSKEAAFKGGEDGKVIEPGKADKSDLYRRITLAATHEDFMPSKADPLTKVQTELIRDWINQGAIWPEEAPPKPVDPPAPSPLSRLVEFKPGAAEQRAIDKLAALGIGVRPIAVNMIWKDANLGMQGTNITDATLAMLKDIPTLVDLNLAGTKITDAGLANLKSLPNLITLHLENTPVTDAGLVHLKGLRNLHYLNLYGTTVGDAGLDQLKGLTNLRRLYLWQTKVTDLAVTNLQKTLPKLEISKGADLTILVKKEEPKKEEPKKEEPKKEEPKKEQPKKEDPKKEEPKKEEKK